MEPEYFLPSVNAAWKSGTKRHRQVTVGFKQGDGVSEGGEVCSPPFPSPPCPTAPPCPLLRCKNFGAVVVRKDRFLNINKYEWRAHPSVDPFQSSLLPPHSRSPCPAPLDPCSGPRIWVRWLCARTAFSASTNTNGASTPATTATARKVWKCVDGVESRHAAAVCTAWKCDAQQICGRCGGFV